MTSPTPAIARTTAVLSAAVPGGGPLLIRDSLEDDECRWFSAALDRSLLVLRECPPGCFRAKKWGVPGPDHFDTPDGNPRHLFSSPHAAVPSLNREYIPHIAAWARAVIDFGYEA